MTQATQTHPSLPAVDPARVQAEPAPILQSVLDEHPLPVIDLDTLPYPDFMHEVEALVEAEMANWSPENSPALEQPEKDAASSDE